MDTVLSAVKYLSKIEGITEGGYCAAPYRGNIAMNTHKGGNTHDTFSVTEILPSYFYNNSQLSRLEGHPMMLQEQLRNEVQARSVIGSFFDMMIKKKPELTPTLFSQNASMSLLVADTPEDMFAKQFRKLHNVGEDEKRWDVLAFEGVEGVQGLMKEYTTSLPQNRHVVSDSPGGGNEGGVSCSFFYRPTKSFAPSPSLEEACTLLCRVGGQRP